MFNAAFIRSIALAYELLVEGISIPKVNVYVDCTPRFFFGSIWLLNILYLKNYIRLNLLTLNWI